MANANDEKRDKWLHIRLDEKELQTLKKEFSATTETYLSSYCRNILLGKPMIKAYRDESLQEIVSVLLSMRKDLNGLTNNFNQQIHKLHTLGHVPQIAGWAAATEMQRKKLLSLVEDIKHIMDKTSLKWLQS